MDEQSFSEKMTHILNYGAVNLAMAIGYRIGLFDVMDTFETAQSAADISDRAGLNPRYVKEWLAIMVIAEIVELTVSEDGKNLYHLPKQHGDLITRRAGNSNLGVYTQEIPLLTACAMEPVIEGFSSGEGVTYDHYPEFQAFMSQLANAKHREVLVNKFLPSVDNGRTLKRLKSGIRVCDLGCAEGVAVTIMAKSFPQSSFIGIDISSEAIEVARREARLQQIENLKFLEIDAADLFDHKELEGFFDYVTAFDAIHDQTRPGDALLGVNHILSPEGLFSMVDIAASSNLADNLELPMGPFLYTVSLMHCMPVGLVNGGSGLGMMWGREKAVEMLENAGFRKVEVFEIPDDPFNLHFLCSR